MLFTAEGTINIKNKKWEDDFTPIDPLITPEYSKAYLRHLVVAKEYLAAQIASVHNLKFYLWLMEEARNQISAGTFIPWKNSMVSKLNQRL
jgi:queuine tRNA-ribosyltransferase